MQAVKDSHARFAQREASLPRRLADGHRHLTKARALLTEEPWRRAGGLAPSCPAVAAPFARRHDELADLIQREAKRLRLPDELEATEIRLRVQTIATRAPA